MIPMLTQRRAPRRVSHLARFAPSGDVGALWIPPRGVEDGHWHYDVRFVVRACGSEAFVVSEESHALAWRRIDDLMADCTCDASLRRMAAKWLARGARVTENT